MIEMGKIDSTDDDGFEWEEIVTRMVDVRMALIAEMLEIEAKMLGDTLRGVPLDHAAAHRLAGVKLQLAEIYKTASERVG